MSGKRLGLVTVACLKIMKHLLILCLCATSSLCFNFDIKGVEEIRARSNDSYFGYALLLQKGTEYLRPIVIVGAPKQDSSHTGGSVYSCFKEGSCTKYNIVANSENSRNGNFLGSVIDGGENIGETFITCAPHITRVIGDSNYLYGSCFLKRNSSDTGFYDAVIKPLENERSVNRDPNNGMLYYDFAFAQTGFDLQYMQDAKTVLLGAPGVKNWNGVLVVYDLKNKQIIPNRVAPYSTDNFGYMGYKVTSSRFETSRQKIWYLVGSPRGSNLLGNVKIYSSTGAILTTLTGDEIGSYYGSALLAADLNNDQIDDALVGAPTGSGTSWDEGYVYFYKRTRSKFENPVKLVGNKKPGARFGTSIVLLGDIDLDSYNDIAIAAPYEDDGIGAVYIYMGSKSGIQPIYSQRVSPMDFPGSFGNVRGFGQGLSRGVDIDLNGHNDIAIGAYKSSQVFVIRTLSIIDYKIKIESNVTDISTGGMELTFCVLYTQRSARRDVRSLPFKLILQLDYRVKGETRLEFSFNVTLATVYCEPLDISVKHSPLDITPFKISLRSEILRKDVIGKGENQLEKFIPYSHGCGDDNICQTKILVEALSSLPYIVLGLNKEIIVNISADNVGEPGYGCSLYMNYSSVLELRNTRHCSLENSTYACPFSGRLEITKIEIPFIFDIKLMRPRLDRVWLNFEVKCLGENSPPGANEKKLELDVILKNSPYIQGSSSPENFYFSDDKLEKNVEVSHIFRIGNTGPSPIKLDVFLKVPVIKVDEMEIFEIDAKGSLNGIEVQCVPTNKSLDLENTYNVNTIMTEQLNKTILIDCLEENIECLTLFCDGDYLYKSTEIAEYNIKITTNTELLVTHYRNELLKKDIFAYVSSAYISNSTKRIEAYSSTMIFTSKSKPIPLWVYIVAGVLGIILLALLVFVLYKCHFFDRNYRDKLNDEKLMDQNRDDNLDHLDPVDLSSIPEQ